jgi:hypothetical protein
LLHGEVRGGEYHDDRIGELAIEVQVSALLRELLSILGFTVAIYKWGRQQVKFRVLPFRVNIQGLFLIGYV